MKLIIDFFLPSKRNAFKAYMLRNWVLLPLLSVFVFLHAIQGYHYLRQQSVLGSSTDLTESQIISLTNLERSKEGVGLLQPNSLLSEAARKKAESMIEAGVFEHYYQEGDEVINPWDFILESGYEYFHAGDNLGKDFQTSSGVVEAWMNSPTHRDNLLNPVYQEIGVAVIEGPYLDKENTTLIVQLFATSAESVAADLDSQPQTPGEISVAPLLESEQSWAQQIVGQYPYILLIATIMVTLIIGLTLFVDIEFAKKRSKEKELSIDLWRH